MGRERRSSPRCASCRQVCDVIVRFEHTGPYCKACGDETSHLHGWKQRPDRRDRDVGPPKIKFAQSNASAFRRPDIRR